MGHRWAISEDELCCREFLKNYVIEKSTMSMSDFVRRLSAQLPLITTNSLRMKVQNIKQLAIEAGIKDTLQTNPLANYSQQNKHAFQKVLAEVKNNKNKD